MFGLGRLHRFIRSAFTQVIVVPEGPEMLKSGMKSGRMVKRRRKPRTVEVAPGERFVWGMMALIIALVGSIALEAVHIVVTGRLSAELLVVISGLVGSFTTAFLLGKE